MDYKKFIKTLLQMEKDGKIDMSTRYELMDMGLSLATDRYSKGLDRGVEISK